MNVQSKSNNKAALPNGVVIDGSYDSMDDMDDKEALNELEDALKQFDHKVNFKSTGLEEVYDIDIESANGLKKVQLIVSLKKITPGGRGIIGEQRIQQYAKYIKYVYKQKKLGKNAISLGVYKNKGQVIFCGFTVNGSDAKDTTPISKQIKIETIAAAMERGFAQQEKKGEGGYVIAFRKEFIFFYIDNYVLLHEKKVEEIANDIEKNENHNMGGENIIYYGVPGCGKSHLLNDKYDIDENLKNGHAERIIFHPDYTYQDFVGQIMPVLKPINITQIYDEKQEKVMTPPSGFGSNGNKQDKCAAEMNEKSEDKRITYEFIPGPFTRILKRAYEAGNNGDNEPYYLVIEEITRGNAAAIFGDIFQLLDRKNGKSEYGITNNDIARKVYGKGHETDSVTLPDNLTILATMNTSDQNVFPLDNAFKRRWKLKMVDNKFTEEDTLKDEPVIIGNQKIRWEDFMAIVNDEILHKNQGMSSLEDKRLGKHFVNEYEIRDPRLFAEKVLMYLWNDAFRMNRESVFDIEKYPILEDLIDGFVNSEIGLGIFDKEGLGKKISRKSR
jgi:MoxR-like ATPase